MYKQKKRFPQVIEILLTGFFICFSILLLDLNRAHADLWSELTGDAARQRTSEARARANELKGKVQQLQTTFQERRTRLQSQSENLQNMRLRIDSVKTNIMSHIEISQKKLSTIGGEVASLQERIKPQITASAQLKQGFGDFLTTGLIVSEGTTALLKIRSFVETSDLPADAWKKAFQMALAHMPLSERPRYFASISEKYIQSFFSGGLKKQTQSMDLVLKTFSDQVPSQDLIEAEQSLEQMISTWTDLKNELDAWQVGASHTDGNLKNAKSALQ